MRRLAARLLLPLAVGLLGVSSPAPAAAQIGDWTLSATADAGAFVPLRQLATNAGTGRQNRVLQVLAEQQSSASFGGGIVATSPSGNTLVRARYMTTSGASSSGRWGVCGDPSNPLGTGALCEPVEVDSEYSAFSVDVGFMQGSVGSRVRPSIHLGAGMRSYSFGTVDCTDPGDWQVVCEAVSEIWLEDGGLSPFLMAGLRLTSDLGPASIWVEAMDQVGPYGGGSDRADGNFQNDLALSGGFTVKVF